MASPDIATWFHNQYPIAQMIKFSISTVILMCFKFSFRLLPTNWLSETSLVVYIQHDSSRTHRGKCVCPVLEEPEQRFSRSMSLSSSYEDKHIKVGSPAEERGRVSNRQDGSLPLFQSRTLNSPRSQRSHPTASLRHGWVCQVF